MKIENLKRLLDLTETIDPKKFDMSVYRKNVQSYFSPECNSVGCLVGYATILDADNVIENFLIEDGIMFFEWSEEFFEIDSDGDVWDYLFNGKWAYKPKTNTLKQAQIRIQKVLNGFNPETDWDNGYTLQTL